MKIASVLASGAVVAQLLAAPVFAATTITVSGNGSDSNNKVNTDMTNTQTVVQNNNANINNNVSANASTGGNTANRNTGGNVAIDTGDASTKVKVENTVNKNVADLSCCLQQDTDILVSGNGDKSKNKVDVDETTTTSVFQDNYANIKNKVDADATSGKNDANRNTGGNVSVTTGDADTVVKVKNQANVNAVRIGSVDGAQAGSVSLTVKGNGSDSKNKIDFDLNKNLTTTQDNVLNLVNWVDADATTGKNDANRNTGGNVSVDTGDAATGVGIDNKANFNVVEEDCNDCLLSVDAAVKKNGDDSKNKIDVDLSNTTSMFQDNSCGASEMPMMEIFGRLFKNGKCSTHVDGNASSGKNDANRNTGTTGHDDPSVTTGDAYSESVVKTNVNQNFAGKLLDMVEIGLW
jgi:hypothetical protein